MRTFLSDFFRLQTVVISSAILLACVGCGTPNESPDAPAAVSSTPAQPNAARVFHSVDHARQSLAGVWVGRAVFDQQALQTLLDDMTPPQRDALLREAQTFASTQIAMQLDPNGGMETAVEVTPVGARPIQGQTIARWKVTQTQGNQVTIATIQNNGLSGPKTTHTVYTVSPDGNRIAMPANVGSALSKCEPLVFLDRQIETRTAQNAQNVQPTQPHSNSLR